MAQNILIGVTGGIAAYKIPLLIRLLKKNGDNVRVVITKAAQEFVTPIVLQALSGESVRTEIFDHLAEQGMSHIELARWADIFLIAPASANTIAKLAHGIADNLLTTLYLATTARVFIAPAMNQQMLAQSITQENLQKLAARERHFVIPPDSGEQACGDVGAGRLPEAETLFQYLQIPAERDLQGLTITITAGGTREAIDPVRYITNHSSGKMGYALAQAAANRGATVNLISGIVNLQPPLGVNLIPVVSALEMYQAALEFAPKSHIFIAAAAVADYRPTEIAPEKLKKNKTALNQILLTENPDIVASVAALKEQRPLTIGFAAETEHLRDYAREKLQKKNLDLIIANDVSKNVFGAEENQVYVISKTHEEEIPRQSKKQLAHELLNRIVQILKYS